MASVTKEVFLSGVTCPTAGWIIRNKAAKSAPSPGDLLRMEEGIEVHKCARRSFPNGEFAAGPDTSAKVNKTMQLMADPGVCVIFEATFTFDGYTAQADVLRRVPEGWHLIEVKSATSDKAELVDDLTYTAMVMTNCGVPPVKASLYLISKDYRRGMPDSQLFWEVDHTQDVQTKVLEFLAAWNRVNAATSLPQMPKTGLRFECKSCGYFETDCLGGDVANHIFDLPRLSQKKFGELLVQGVTSIADIPTSFDLTDNQKRVRDCVVSGKEHVGKSLKANLNSVDWPAYYLDFETVMTAIPLYADLPPYTQLPTQYSIHVCSAPGKVVRHSEFLADPAKDCRRELADKLVADLDNKGSIIVYHAGFEKTVISKLADQFSDLSGKLTAILGRILDLEAFILQGYYHPKFQGSSSIKQTLPVMVPSMTYENLEIGNGDAAVAMFARMAKRQVEPEEAEKIRNNLLAYCKQDTLAMVHLHKCLAHHTHRD